jgi:hypothetical protein
MSTGSRNQSSAPPSTAGDPFYSINPTFVYFGEHTNTLRVGACTSLHRGPVLDAWSALDPDHVVSLMRDGANRENVFNIEKRKFDSLVGGTWMEGISEATRSQVKNGEKDGYDIFARSLRKNVEAFANGAPSLNVDPSNVSCQLDVVATPKDFPVGTVASVVPVHANDLEPPTVKLNWRGSDSRTGLASIEVDPYCSLEVHNEDGPIAMKPTKHAWRLSVNDSFRPIRDDCKSAMVTMISSPTEENKAAVVQSIVKAIEFLNIRDMTYLTNIVDIEPQWADHQDKENAKCKSDWSFDVPGNPRMTVRAKPVPGLQCLPREGGIQRDLYF